MRSERRDIEIITDARDKNKQRGERKKRMCFFFVPPPPSVRISPPQIADRSRNRAVEGDSDRSVRRCGRARPATTPRAHGGAGPDPAADRLPRAPPNAGVIPRMQIGGQSHWFAAYLAELLHRTSNASIVSKGPCRRCARHVCGAPSVRQKVFFSSRPQPVRGGPSCPRLTGSGAYLGTGGWQLRPLPGL